MENEFWIYSRFSWRIFSFTVNFRCKSLIKYQQAPISCESESAQTALPTEQIITQYTGPTIHQSGEETIVSDHLTWILAADWSVSHHMIVILIDLWVADDRLGDNMTQTPCTRLHLPLCHPHRRDQLINTQTFLVSRYAWICFSAAKNNVLIHEWRRHWWDCIVIAA